MKMNKKKREYLLIIFSFFIGCIVGMIFLQTRKEDNRELKKIIQNAQDAEVTIESYNGTVREGTGSGFIYKIKNNKAYVLTNEHVLSEKVMVINQDGKECEGTILGKDKSMDTAVVEINKNCAKKTVKLGDSGKVEVGDNIFTITSPVGKEYQGTITKGIISGVNRTVSISSEEEQEWIMNAIQFDAMINPGSSGGALLNEKGQVIGICSLKLIKEEIEGMSFAIPINGVKKNLEALEKGNDIKYPELGIAMVNTNNTEVLQEYNISLTTDIAGVVIIDIKKDSSAEKKLQKGDIIVGIEDSVIKDTDQVKYALTNYKVGETVNIKVIRNNKEKTIKVVLKEAS